MSPLARCRARSLSPLEDRESVSGRSPLRRRLCVSIVLVAASLTIVGGAHAATAGLDLGTSGGFAVLGGSAVTNSGFTVLNGDLGVSPELSITGFPPGIVNGDVHAGDEVAAFAQRDAASAYDDAARRPPTAGIADDLGGLRLPSGVYRAASSIGLTGTLELDAQGDPTAVFIFQIGSDLTTAAASRVSLLNGAQACNVYWQVGSSATFGASSTFRGNTLAFTSTTLGNSVTVDGRMFAREGAVTLDTDTITPATCSTPPGDPDPTGGTDDGSGSNPGGSPSDPSSGTPGGSGGSAPGDSGSNPGGSEDAPTADAPGSTGTARFRAPSGSVVKKIRQFGTRRCISTRVFPVTVSGEAISRVVFSVDGRTVSSRRGSPFTAQIVRPRSGVHTVRARVTFTDGTRAITLNLRFRSCETAVARAPRGSVGLSG